MLRGLCMVLALVMVLMGCGGDERTPSAPTLPTQPTGGPAPTSPMESNTSSRPTREGTSFSLNYSVSGYTSRLDVTELTARTEITNAMPKYTQLLVEFAWMVTNTTQGRNNIMPASSLNLRFPATNEECFATDGTSTLAGKYCTISLGFYPRDTSPAAIAAGASRNGRYSPTTRRIQIKEGLPLTALRFGLNEPLGVSRDGCSGQCWFLLSGQPAPRD